MNDLVSDAVPLNRRFSRLRNEDNFPFLPAIENGTSDHVENNASSSDVNKDVNNAILQPQSHVNVMHSIGVHLGPVINYSRVTNSTSGDSVGRKYPKPAVAHVQQLLRCNREVTDEDKFKCATFLGHKWQKLGILMGYTSGQLENIAADNPRQDGRAQELLCRWHDRESYGATLNVLTAMLVRLKAYGCLAKLEP